MSYLHMVYAAIKLCRLSLDFAYYCNSENFGPELKVVLALKAPFAKVSSLAFSDFKH